MVKVTDTHLSTPRVTLGKFTSLLETYASPSLLRERPAAQYFQAIVNRGVDPLFMLAMFQHESGMGSEGTAIETHSWGNTRRPLVGPTIPVGTAQGRSGFFPIWANWLDGLISTVDRLASTVYPAGAIPYGKRTIGGIFQDPSGVVWAPAGDLNDPGGYLASVLNFMNQHQDVKEGKLVHVALAAGHHQQDDYKNGQVLSNGDEFDFSGKLVQAVATELRKYPTLFRVTVVTPNDGRGVYPGGLWDVARAFCATGADISLELHSQGIGNSNLRGAFVVYPDAPGDYDVDAIAFAKHLLPSITRHVGVPQYDTGLLSERRTQVGIDGYRLGIFNLSSSCKATQTRVLVENLHHSNPVENRLMKDPATFPKFGRAYAEALASFYGLTLPATAGKVPLPGEGTEVQVPAEGTTEVRVVDGQTVVITNYGPVERDVVEASVNTVRQTATMKNRRGERYDRSNINNAMSGFTRVG